MWACKRVHPKSFPRPMVGRGEQKDTKMQTKVTVLAETVQTRDGVEYVSVTCMEAGPEPLLQMFDYGLRQEEKIHKGKLVGKTMVLKWDNIRSIFSGRPQVNGRIVSVG